MLRSGPPRAEKFPDFDRGHLAAGGKIGLVQNERAPVLVSVEKPSVTIFAMVDLSLAISASACGNDRP
jgi:hypothetical protein